MAMESTLVLDLMRSRNVTATLLPATGLGVLRRPATAQRLTTFWQHRRRPWSQVRSARRVALAVALALLAASSASAFVSLPCFGPRRVALARLAARAAAVPAMWTAGPGEVYTGQAQKALYLLRENDMLFESSVDEALEEIALQREREDRQQSEVEGGTTEAGADALTLRRRMGEVREQDRMRIVKELLYVKVLAKFRALEVPLIHPLKGGGDVRLGMFDWNTLTADVFSKDALELVREHLFRITGQQEAGPMMGSLAVVRLAQFQVGQVYAMSALFGYYLRRVDARYQLEKLAGSFGAWGDAPRPQDVRRTNLLSMGAKGGDDDGIKSLKDYISNFGPEEVNRMTSIVSVEAKMAMEHQVTALFGDLAVLKERLLSALGMSASQEEATRKLEQAMQRNEVESLRITNDDLRRLILEAVAFGSLLCDAEKQIDTIYDLTPTASHRPAVFGLEEDTGPSLSQ